MSNPHIVYIALGSNVGDRQSNLMQAIQGLREQVAVDQLSSIYETEPAYYLDQPFFLNMVCGGQTNLAPDQLLHFLKRLEQRLGRQSAIRFGPRSIDLDILLYDDQIIEQQDLAIPHPRMAERPFVLVPLAEIAPDLVPPGFHQSVAELAQHGDIHDKIVRSRDSLIPWLE